MQEMFDLGRPHHHVPPPGRDHREHLPVGEPALHLPRLIDQERLAVGHQQVGRERLAGEPGAERRDHPHRAGQDRPITAPRFRARHDADVGRAAGHRRTAFW
jgi:hypothetical protein